MNSIATINQRSTIFPDIDTKHCGDLGDEHIHFNVHKIYTGLDSFTLQSSLLVKCGKGYELKIEQTLRSVYNFTDNALTNAVLNETIAGLFADSLHSLQQHIENAKKNATRTMPSITITDHILKNYLASLNYKDLHKSCFSRSTY